MGKRARLVGGLFLLWGYQAGGGENFDAVFHSRNFTT